MHGRWGVAGLAPVTFLGENMENFNSLFEYFNILKLSIQSIQNPAFRKCIYISSKFVCSLWSPLTGKCTFILLYTTHNLKTCLINNTSRASAESKKVRYVSKRGGGGGLGGLQKNVHAYDVSCGQNRYVTLPFQEQSLTNQNVGKSIVTWKFIY